MNLSHPLLPPTLLGYLFLTLLLVKDIVNNGHTLHAIILSACYSVFIILETHLVSINLLGYT